MINRYTFILCFCMFALIATKAFAQIPNASFENWTAGNPDGWNTLNNTITYVTQSTTAHEGSSAAQSTATSPGGPTYIVSFIYSGTQSNNFFPCGCRPDALHFWYILQPAGGETLSAYVGGRQSGSTVAAGVATFSTPTAVYTEGVVDVGYAAAGDMDSMSISFLMSGNPGYTQGTYFIVDDLAWGAAGTGIDETSLTGATLESVSPNPTQNSASIIYNLSQSADVNLEIYDALGRLVKVVLNEKQGVGRYKAVEDFSTLAAGVYTCRLTANGHVQSSRFVVTP